MTSQSTAMPERCPWCGNKAHPMTYALRHTERRHGTYINAAIGLHVGHSLTARPGPLEVSLFCHDCQRTVITAGNNGRWRGEYQMPACTVP